MMTKEKNRQECVLSVFSQKARPFGANQLIHLPQNELRRAHWYILNNYEELQLYLDCIVNDVRFHTKALDERHTTKNSCVVVPEEHDDNAIDFYSVVTTVLQLNYILGYKENTQRLSSYINQLQAQQVFYIDDYKLGTNWKVVQNIQHRHLWDILEMNDIENSQDTDNVYQENESSDIHFMVQENDLELGQYHRVDVSVEKVAADVIVDIEKQTINDDIFKFENEDETIMDYCSDNEECLLNNDDIDDE
ncbi:hypothetical protein Ddye_000856 [Dipteronia dyeriana]|uniref:Uncharacterized protein n=1 Tax=Dipteronia dyeriana TaxID=168575 RepID=A0AAD9XN87_9ROSI|nr:hypothetical protein Ddye_000856 [Dipteronia dyeriana]